MEVKVDKVVVGSGLEVTVKEQQEQGRVKHEKRKGDMTERWTTLALQTPLEPCM